MRVAFSPILALSAILIGDTEHMNAEVQRLLWDLSRRLPLACTCSNLLLQWAVQVVHLHPGGE